MADWRKLAMAALLADGKIDETEVKILKKELWEDGKIDDDEVKFLIDLRTAAQKKAKARKEELLPAFEKLFFKAIGDNVLKDGKIDAAEAGWLRTALFADGKIDAGEYAFLKLMKKSAKATSPEFESLYTECVGKYEKANKIATDKPAEKTEKAPEPTAKAEKPAAPAEKAEKPAAPAEKAEKPAKAKPPKAEKAKAEKAEKVAKMAKPARVTKVKKMSRVKKVAKVQ